MANLKIQPLYDKVVVKRIEDIRSAGGIVIPDTAAGKSTRGKVVAVGSGKMTDEGKYLPMRVKIDDIVIFGQYAGSEIKIDGVDYLVIREDEIVAIVG